MDAVLYGTMMRWKVSPSFADQCFDRIGKVIQHPLLGSLFCHKCELDVNGNIQKVLFVGTTSREKCQTIVSV